jgi:hypothetical protein
VKWIKVRELEAETKQQGCGKFKMNLPFALWGLCFRKSFTSVNPLFGVCRKGFLVLGEHPELCVPAESIASP